MQTVQELLSEWGERVALMRAAKGLTRQDLADRCGVNVTTIWRLEQGRHNPHDALKWNVAGALGVRMDVLWAWPAVVPPAPVVAA
jgi:putative transcriptional regulator